MKTQIQHMDPSITLTRQDLERLHEVLGKVHSDEVRRRIAEQLETELERARVVAPEDVPGDVITMNSTVVFVDQEGRRRQLDLVYPEAAGRGRLSVLSPMGAALLGLTVGDSIDWPMPDGTTSTLHVLDVVYQPEQAGDYHL